MRRARGGLFGSHASLCLQWRKTVVLVQTQYRRAFALVGVVAFLLGARSTQEFLVDIEDVFQGRYTLAPYVIYYQRSPRPLYPVSYTSDILRLPPVGYSWVDVDELKTITGLTAAKCDLRDWEFVFVRELSR